jgi:hypothetical protein
MQNQKIGTELLDGSFAKEHQGGRGGTESLFRLLVSSAACLFAHRRGRPPNASCQSRTSARQMFLYSTRALHLVQSGNPGRPHRPRSRSHTARELPATVRFPATWFGSHVESSLARPGPRQPETRWAAPWPSLRLIENMTRDHVAQCARLIVVAAAAFHTKRFGYGNLHVIDIPPVPDRLEMPFEKRKTRMF